MIRGFLGISQEEFGSMIGVTGSAVVQWEKGKATPYPKTLKKISEVSGKSLDWLKGKEDGPVEVANGASPLQISESEDPITQQFLLKMLSRQQENMDRLTGLMVAQQDTIEAQRQDTARLTEALVRALDRVGEDRELRDKRLEKRIAELESKLAKVEKQKSGGRATATI